MQRASIRTRALRITSTDTNTATARQAAQLTLYGKRTFCAVRTARTAIRSSPAEVPGLRGERPNARATKKTRDLSGPLKKACVANGIHVISIISMFDQLARGCHMADHASPAPGLASVSAAFKSRLDSISLRAKRACSCAHQSRHSFPGKRTTETTGEAARYTCMHSQDRSEQMSRCVVQRLVFDPCCLHRLALPLQPLPSLQFDDFEGLSDRKSSKSRSSVGRTQRRRNAVAEGRRRVHAPQGRSDRDGSSWCAADPS